jgi:eukaryotic-like serine/threonine-protein kinase
MNPWVPALEGQTLAGYHLDIGSYLGGGAFGLVFEVTEVSTNSHYAMKILVPGDPQTAVEFNSEGALLQKLINCSEVIDWVDSGTVVLDLNLNGKQVQLPFGFHVMALATGTLEDLIVDPARRAAMPWLELLSLWRRAIKGVHQMHFNDVAHRDLKSSNCLLMERSKDLDVRISDLGRSKDLSLPPSVSPIFYAVGRGDPRHAPPEHVWFQGGGTAEDFRNADLYGLGSLFAEIATGHPMTGLALGSAMDLQKARLEGAQDHQKGHRRDLAVLRPKFHRAIDQIDLPPVIRHDARQLLKQLCDPVSSERQPRRGGKRHRPDPGLLWLLRRADIMTHQLSIEERRVKQSQKKQSRSAS